jgi:hypothetical protein
VSDLFKSLSGGIARFAFAWLLPSAVTLGLAWIFLSKEVAKTGIGEVIGDSAATSSWAPPAIFALLTLTLALVFAYTSLPIYRVLEGLALPPVVQQALLRRQAAAWHQLRQAERRSEAGLRVDPLLIERRDAYPLEIKSIRPTRLGNALAALEEYGNTRFSLDSQRYWYELNAVASDGLRRELEDARAPVDFFVSAIAHSALLGTFSLVVGVASGSPAAFLLCILSFAIIPVAYNGAVKNVKDWAGSVRALVNLGRLPLASSLGIAMPDKLDDERHMWESFTGAIVLADASFIDNYDDHRVQSMDQHDEPEEGTPVGGEG